MQSPRMWSILSTLLFFIAFVSAVSWQDMSPIDSNGVLVVRQDNNEDSSPSSAAETDEPQQTSAASASRVTSAPASGSATGTITSGQSRASGTAVSSVSGSRVGNSTRTTAVDIRDPPGGVSMIMPAQTDPMTFIKVGDKITFAWNYTSLLIPPNNVDVVATNAVNHQTYTIAANTSWSETQTVIWDTANQTSSLPFVVASYTLMIYDAETEPTAVPSPGRLGLANSVVFGVYTAQAYKNYTDFNCATCGAAMSLHEKQALKVIFGSCIVTILSFVWFASGFGLI